MSLLIASSMSAMTLRVLGGGAREIPTGQLLLVILIIVIPVSVLYDKCAGFDVTQVLQFMHTL